MPIHLRNIFSIIFSPGLLEPRNERNVISLRSELPSFTGEWQQFIQDCLLYFHIPQSIFLPENGFQSLFLGSVQLHSPEALVTAKASSRGGVSCYKPSGILTITWELFENGAMSLSLALPNLS